MSKSDLPSQDDMITMMAKIMPGGVGIELQEKRGQQEVVSMDILPKRVMDNIYPDPVKVYAMLDIEVTGEADNLFYTVKLPAGWRKEAADHDMHSFVLDAYGRKRIHIFYKAAFYDRVAHATIERRFGYGRTWDETMDRYSDFVIITDAGTEIHREHLPDDGGYEAAATYGETWLNEHYPEWQNRFAYWNL
jgi:hypothetical protein